MWWKMVAWVQPPAGGVSGRIWPNEAGKEVHAVGICIGEHRGEEAIACAKLRGQLVIVGQVGLVVVAAGASAGGIDGGRHRERLLQETIHFAAVDIGVTLIPEGAQVLGAHGLEMKRVERLALTIVQRGIHGHAIDVVGIALSENRHLVNYIIALASILP